ncbi:MAG: hypothetical protein DME57_01875 [Verrucomicrobia bacterium]|nr:MAG: hypothetical protein DME57_01875 [Verrucomicrobiota bacterium]
MKRKTTKLAKSAKRSRAFTDALERARSLAKNPKALRALYDAATRKMGALPKAPFNELWGYFQTMLRLIRAYYRGEYRNISVTNLVLIIAAIIYVLNPWDVIPDWLPGLGFIDDATILAFAFQKTRDTLEDFTSWEGSAR